MVWMRDLSRIHFLWILPGNSEDAADLNYYLTCDGEYAR